jgi:hypothetical protein
LPPPASRSGEALFALTERKLMQAILDRELQFLELNDPLYIGKPVRLFEAQLLVETLMLRQEAKDTGFHISHSIER